MPIWPNRFQTPVIMPLPLFHIMPGKSYLPRSWREIDFSKRLPDCAVTIQVNDVELLWRKYVTPMSAYSVCLLGCGFIWVILKCNPSCFISFAVFSRESRQGLPLQLGVSSVVCLNHPTQKGQKVMLNFEILFSSIRVNVGCGPAEERVLLTGLHAVADIYCENCKTTLGWKYVSSGSDWIHTLTQTHTRDHSHQTRRLTFWQLSPAGQDNSSVRDKTQLKQERYFKRLFHTLKACFPRH